MNLRRCIQSWHPQGDARVGARQPPHPPGKSPIIYFTLWDHFAAFSSLEGGGMFSPYGGLFSKYFLCVEAFLCSYGGPFWVLPLTISPAGAHPNVYNMVSHMRVRIPPECVQYGITHEGAHRTRTCTIWYRT